MQGAAHAIVESDWLETFWDRGERLACRRIFRDLTFENDDAAVRRYVESAIAQRFQYGQRRWIGGARQLRDRLYFGRSVVAGQFLDDAGIQRPRVGGESQQRHDKQRHERPQS